MRVCYGVQWIEVEFGQRDEGYKLFVSLKQAKERSEEDTKAGHYQGGYCGPEKPLTIYEIPVDCLPDKLKRYIEAAPDTGSIFSDNHWQPKLKAVAKL